MYKKPIDDQWFADGTYIIKVSQDKTILKVAKGKEFEFPTSDLRQLSNLFQKASGNVGGWRVDYEN